MTAAGAGIRFAAIGLEHGHINHQVGRLIEQGCTCAGFATHGHPGPLDDFERLFPDVPRVDDERRLLEDDTIRLVVTADVPGRRAEVAIAAMRHEKDVMTDKPGAIALEQLDAIKRVQAETGRIWSVNFSERFEVRAVSRAAELVEAGEIGRVVQTVGFGPHRLGAGNRPAWFFDRTQNAGILADLASHQIDQFLHFTGSDDADVVASQVANHANPEHPELDDFGDVLLRSAHASGYVRVDWYTPESLPVFGDGRLVILGTAGYIELRKYVDIAGRAGGDHLFLVTDRATRHVDCADAPLPYYERLCADIQQRTETAMPQAHCFKATELALLAEARAVRIA